MEPMYSQDRSTFASQITNGLAVPKIVNGTQEKGKSDLLKSIVPILIWLLSIT